MPAPTSITLSNPNDFAEVIATPEGYVIVSRTGSAGTGSGFVLPGVVATPPVASNFVWLNQTGGGGSASVVSSTDWIYLQADGWSGTQLRCQLETALTAPYTLTAGVIPAHVMPNNSHSGIFLRESSSGKLITFSIAQNGNYNDLTVIHWTDPQTYAGQYNVQILVPFPLWLQIENISGFYNFGYSADGLNFIPIHTENFNAFFSGQPDGDGFYANSNNGSQLAVGITVFSWLRV